MLIDALIYLASFIAIWFGAGLIVASADRFSKKLRLSSFAVSFVILGMLTSTPEFAVGLTSVAEKNPEVFIGNIIGGVPVLFLLIVPILAILGNGIKLTTEFPPIKLLFSFLVIISPIFFILDKTVTNYEAITILVLYCMLFFIVQRNKGLLDMKNGKLLSAKSYSLIDILKVILGLGIVFVSSQIIVDKTVFFAETFNISIFLVSLLLLSIGTNLPELSLAIRSVVLGKKDVAFGDYVGSGAANAFIFALLTLIYDGSITTESNFIGAFAIIVAGLSLFFFFSRRGNGITRREGFILLLFYIAFLAFGIIA